MDDRFPTTPTILAAERAVEPALSELGLGLVGCELLGGASRPTLRVYVEREGGTSIDDCVAAHHAITDLLDAEDLFPGAWVLEVSSPGEKRPLFRRSQLESILGQRVKLRMRIGFENRRKATGTARALDGDDLLLVLEEGEEIRVPLDDIDRCHLAPEGDPS